MQNPSLPEMVSYPDGLQSEFVPGPGSSDISRVDSAISQFLNISAAKIQAKNNNATTTAASVQAQEQQKEEEAQDQQASGSNVMVTGLVEGTKTNYGQQWIPKFRGHHQSRDMIYLKELIEQLKEASNQMIQELGRFPSDSPIVETARAELEETCKRLTQSIGIGHPDKPNNAQNNAQGGGGGGGQNLQWLVEFWKIKYKEVAEKYNKLVLTVKQKFGPGQVNNAATAANTLQWQQQQQQQQQLSGLQQQQQQQQQQQVQQQYMRGRVEAVSRTTSIGTAANSQYVSFNTSLVNVDQQPSVSGYTHSAVTAVPMYQQSQASLSPRPMYSNAGTASIGPTPPETPRSFHPQGDLQDPAILFVENIPLPASQSTAGAGAGTAATSHQASRVNVIRCDRVRPVPVKARSRLRLEPEIVEEEQEPAVQHKIIEPIREVLMKPQAAAFAPRYNQGIVTPQQHFMQQQQITAQQHFMQQQQTTKGITDEGFQKKSDGIIEMTRNLSSATRTESQERSNNRDSNSQISNKDNTTPPASNPVAQQQSPTQEKPQMQNQQRPQPHKKQSNTEQKKSYNNTNSGSGEKGGRQQMGRGKGGQGGSRGGGQRSKNNNTNNSNNNNNDSNSNNISGSGNSRGGGGSSYNRRNRGGRSRRGGGRGGGNGGSNNNNNNNSNKDN